MSHHCVATNTLLMKKNCLRRLIVIFIIAFHHNWRKKCGDRKKKNSRRSFCNALCYTWIKWSQSPFWIHSERETNILLFTMFGGEKKIFNNNENMELSLRFNFISSLFAVYCNAIYCSSDFINFISIVIFCVISIRLLLDAVFFCHWCMESYVERTLNFWAWSRTKLKYLHGLISYTKSYIFL